MLAPNPNTVVKIEMVSKYDIGRITHVHERFTYLDGRTEMKHLLVPIWDETDLPGYLATLKKPYQ